MIHLCAKFMHLPYNAWHHVKLKRHACSTMVTAGTVIIACNTDTEYI